MFLLADYGLLRSLLVTYVRYAQRLSAFRPFRMGSGPVRFRAYSLLVALLRDLVHRSALRSRAAGALDLAAGGLPAGMEFHSFEVTDLLIPADTDWGSGIPNFFGDSLEVEVGRTMFGSSFIHLAAPLVDDGGVRTLTVSAYQVTGDNGSIFSAALDSVAGDYYGFSNSRDTVQTVDGTTVDIDDGETVQVQGALRLLGGPFVADTHIIRAHCSFLLF